MFAAIVFASVYLGPLEAEPIGINGNACIVLLVTGNFPSLGSFSFYVTTSSENVYFLIALLVEYLVI